MKKILVILFCCALALSLSACGKAPEVAQNAQDNGQPYSGSIEDLINQGKSVKCVLEADEATGILSGTTYVSGKTARSDFEQKESENKTISVHMIVDETWMYSWNDNDKNQAFKFKMEDMQNEALKGQANEQGAENYEDKMDYKCYSWRVDQSYLTPPADVNFQDMSELLKQFNTIGNNAANGVPALNNVDTSALCGQCDQISEAAAKASCKQSLGCK